MNINITEISLTGDVTRWRIPALKCIQPVVSAFKDKLEKYDCYTVFDEKKKLFCLGLSKH